MVTEAAAAVAQTTGSSRRWSYSSCSDDIAIFRITEKKYIFIYLYIDTHTDSVYVFTYSFYFHVYFLLYTKRNFTCILQTHFFPICNVHIFLCSCFPLFLTFYLIYLLVIVINEYVFTFFNSEIHTFRWRRISGRRCTAMVAGES